MKKTFIISLVLGTILLAGCTAEYPNELAVHSFDTAIIKYDVSGTFSGEETLYIRGDQKVTHRAVLTEGAEENVLEMVLGEVKYVADLEKATATKLENTDYGKLKNLSREEREKFVLRKELGLKEGAQLPEAQGETEVAGQICKIYFIENLGSACVWNNTVLRKEISILGAIKRKEAVSVETGVEIPNERFELPAGVILTNP